MACYLRQGGYDPLKKALTMTAKDLPDGKKMSPQDAGRGGHRVDLAEPRCHRRDRRSPQRTAGTGIAGAADVRLNAEDMREIEQALTLQPA